MTPSSSESNASRASAAGGGTVAFAGTLLGVVGIAALAAAIPARLALPDAMYDRYLLLVAFAVVPVAATLRRKAVGVSPRAATAAAFLLLVAYAVAVCVQPPPHAGLRTACFAVPPDSGNLVYVEGGNGLGTLWPEASAWTMKRPPDPSAFEATNGSVALRIERIADASEGAELGDYADLALSDFVDRGEQVVCEYEGAGAYGDRPTAWRSIGLYEDERDDTPRFGVVVAFAEDESVYVARLDAPTQEELLDAVPTVRAALARATADPSAKAALVARVAPPASVAPSTNTSPEYRPTPLYERSRDGAVRGLPFLPYNVRAR